MDEGGLDERVGGVPSDQGERVELSAVGKGREAGASLEGGGEDEGVRREAEREHAREEREGGREEEGAGEGGNEGGEDEGVGVGCAMEQEGSIREAEVVGVVGEELGGEVGVSNKVAGLEEASMSLLGLQEGWRRMMEEVEGVEGDGEGLSLNSMSLESRHRKE